jgi:hypothetical protein
LLVFGVGENDCQVFGKLFRGVALHSGVVPNNEDTNQASDGKPKEQSSATKKGGVPIPLTCPVILTL